MAAPITFIGIAAEVVGVVQIDFQVPSTVAAGSQPVVVTIGNVASRRNLAGRAVGVLARLTSWEVIAAEHKLHW